MNYYLYALIILMLTSCGASKKMSVVKTTNNKTKIILQQQSSKLDSIRGELAGKTKENAIDSVLDEDIKKVLNKLSDQLNSVQQISLIMDAATRNKSAFRKKSHSSDILSKLIVLDSFNVSQQRREEVYRMLEESVSLTRYKRFHLAAFFDKGVYKIPTTAQKNIVTQFSPIVDSLSNMSNRYQHIPREARIVFVGYSDETPIIEEGMLYNELKRALNAKEASQKEMNQILSDLRAKEMIRNMKIVVNANSYKFRDYDSLKIGYIAYGRGEEHPSPAIKDYKARDERRRIVLSYWIVLPQLSGL